MKIDVEKCEEHSGDFCGMYSYGGCYYAYGFGYSDVLQLFLHSDSVGLES